MGAIAFYIGIFKNEKYKEIIPELASFGDFTGGTLNPILAVLSLFALLVTIYIQNKELKYTRKELEKSAQAQIEQSEALEIQNQSIMLQSFESTFFKLFELHNQQYQALNNNLEMYNKQILREHDSSPTSEYMVYTFEKYNKMEMKTYLLTLLELLVFIGKKEGNKNINLYIGLLKASISNGYILTYISIFCMINKKFKKMIEEYVLLENLNLIGRTRQDEICLILMSFDDIAFGSNVDLLNMINLKRKSGAESATKMK